MYAYHTASSTMTHSEVTEARAAIHEHLANGYLETDLDRAKHHAAKANEIRSAMAVRCSLGYGDAQAAIRYSEMMKKSRRGA